MFANHYEKKKLLFLCQWCRSTIFFLLTVKTFFTVRKTRPLEASASKMYMVHMYELWDWKEQEKTHNLDLKRQLLLFLQQMSKLTGTCPNTLSFENSPRHTLECLHNKSMAQPVSYRIHLPLTASRSCSSTLGTHTPPAIPTSHIS